MECCPIETLHNNIIKLEDIPLISEILREFYKIVYTLQLSSLIEWHLRPLWSFSCTTLSRASRMTSHMIVANGIHGNYGYGIYLTFSNVVIDKLHDAIALADAADYKSRV